MLEHHLDIATADGAVNRFVVFPEEGGPFPVVPKLQSARQQSGVPHRIEWYPGVEHGLVFPLRAGLHNRPAAERHRERPFSLFACMLQVPR